MQGESVTLRCTVSSEPIESVQSSWYKDGVLLFEEPPRITIRYNENDGLYELTLNPLTMNDTGSYTCHFNNTVIPATVERTINLTVIKLCKFIQHTHTSMTQTLLFGYLETMLPWCSM